MSTCSSAKTQEYVLDSKIELDIVTLLEAKSWMKVDFSDDDALIEMLIQSAIDQAEECMNRDLLTTTWINYRNCFNQDLTLRKGKFQSVEQIEYLVDDVYTILPTTEYTVQIGGIFGVICELTDPGNVDDNCNAVKITFKTGYGDNTSFVPAAIKTALLEHVAFMYENRGDCGGVDDAPSMIKKTYEKYKIIDLVGNVQSGCL